MFNRHYHRRPTFIETIVTGIVNLIGMIVMGTIAIFMLIFDN